MNLPNDIVKNFNKIIKKNQKVLADRDEALPYNTNIVGTIRIEVDDPVYSKS